MKNYHFCMRVAAFSLLAVSMIANLVVNQVLAKESAVAFKAAKLKKTVKPSYPNERVGKVADLSADSGLVELLFMINQAGETFEPVVLRSTHAKFEKEALRALAKYQYQPAKLGQSATESRSSNSVVFKFKAGDLRDARGAKQNIEIERTRGLTDGYSSFYEQFTQELARESPSQEKALQLLERIQDVKHQSFYSLSYLALGKYRFAELFGDSADKITALENLIWVDAQVEPKYKILSGDTKQSVWTALLKLQIEASFFAEALNNFKQVASDDRKINDIFAETIQQVDALKQGENIVQRTVKVGARGYHAFDLLKKSFMFEQVQGSAESIILRCDTRFEQMGFKADSKYQIPASWGNCNLQINADTGTTAVVLQQ